MEVFLRLLMLLLELFGKLSSSDQAEVAAEFRFRDLLDIFRGGMPDIGGDGDGNQPAWLTIVILILQIIARLNDNDTEEAMQKLQAMEGDVQQYIARLNAE